MSFFDQTELNQQPSAEPNPDTTRTKRPRSSLACIRCRKKKVKCDFIQPTCGRCTTAGLPCSYATPPRRVDGQAFDQLGGHVEELKERMQKIQSDLVMMKSNLHPTTRGDGPTILQDTRGSSFQSQQPQQQQQLSTTTTAQQPVTWKLSLSPSGLRIDTNIASVADLYRILLNGISQLNISGDSATSLFSMDSLRGAGNNDGGTKNKSNRASRAWGRYAKYRGGGGGPTTTTTTGTTTMGMDHALVPSTATLPYDSSRNTISSPSSTASSPGRLWEVNETEAARIILQEKQAEDTMHQDTLNQLVTKTYHCCFLAYQIVDQTTFGQLYGNSGLDPLLANSVNAWVSKHGCIFHGACPEKDPSLMGETYFKNARQLLKKCFDISSPTTIHALINLYMYQLSCERSSLAYLYIGLAIRMAQDLKFHKKEFMPADPVLKEANKRLWWTAYWLDLVAALESNRPTMVSDKDCDLEYPVKLDHEDDETGYRIGFTVHSIKLMKVRKDITKHLPSEQSGQSLLSAISRLENALTNWLQELPIDLRLDPDDRFRPTNSFRDEACLILNIQYQTTWIMLHKFFLPKKDQTSTPVALLSLNICTKSANFITKMLDLYRQHLPWCQFFYCLDGVIASVTIHQVNAMSTEQEVAHLAQRNLIVTADILRQSPLIYMEKVNEIVESVEGFLKKNKLPTMLHDFPLVNNESIHQQCLSSVFHPTTTFEQATNTFIPQELNQQHVTFGTPPVMTAPDQQQQQGYLPPSNEQQDNYSSPSFTQTYQQHVQPSPSSLTSSSSSQQHLGFGDDILVNQTMSGTMDQFFFGADMSFHSTPMMDSTSINQLLTPNHQPFDTSFQLPSYTTSSLNDILYGDALTQQDTILSTTTTTTTTNTPIPTNTTTTNTTPNTTLSSGFHFSMPGFADMFTTMTNDMNTGQKRLHREWDDAH